MNLAATCNYYNEEHIEDIYSDSDDTNLVHAVIPTVHRLKS